jgi:hypothetical protein
MNITLDQAVEMHAKALKYRAGVRAPAIARDRARRCVAAGDQGGYDIWQNVASQAEALLASDAAIAEAAVFASFPLTMLPPTN